MDQQQPYNELAEQVDLHGQISNANNIARQGQQVQYQVEEQEKNLAEAQLECDKTLNTIYHLLKQDVLRPTEDGIMDWFPITDSKKRVLTDEGVDKIMQVMRSYVNKETLLSNFDAKQIQSRMLRFCLALNANMFMKYEVYFRVPSLEECHVLLKERIKDKLKIKQITADVSGITLDTEATKKQILAEMEDRVEYELTKIKAEQTKINLREYELIFTQLEALVEATHNRAFRGEERGSLRRHFNISEVIGGAAPQGMKKSGGWFGLGGNK